MSEDSTRCVVHDYWYYYKDSCPFCDAAGKDATIAALRAEVERLKGEVQQLCLDASPPPDPPKSIKLVSGVQGKSGGVHQPRKQASPEAAPDAVGFPPDTDI